MKSLSITGRLSLTAIWCLDEPPIFVSTPPSTLRTVRVSRVMPDLVRLLVAPNVA